MPTILTCAACGVDFAVKPSHAASRSTCSSKCKKAGRKPRQISERFLSKVQRSDGCWEWTASRNANNYGRIGRGGKYGKIELAHRVAWELAFGLIPSGLDVLHKCDNPPCVRPDHLFLGTQAHNMADMNAKGRAAPGPMKASPGAKNGNHKLTEADVLAIRASASGTADLSRTYGVSRDTITLIRTRKSWKHI